MTFNRSFSNSLDEGTLIQLRSDPQITWQEARAIEKFEPRQAVALELQGTNHKVNIVGAIEEHEIVPGYRVWRITEPGGRTHWIDRNLLDNSDTVLATKSEIPTRYTNRFADQKKEGLVLLDHSHLQKEYCRLEKLMAITPQFNSMKKLVDRNLKYNELLRKKDSYVYQCIGGAIGGMFLNISDGIYREHKRDAGSQDWMTMHGSNFVRGLILMNITHRCLSAARPDHRDAFLAATLGANTVGNVMNEIKLPYLEEKFGIQQKGVVPGYSNYEKPIQTDLGDFNSGMMATLLYWVATKTAEEVYRVKLRGTCSR